jgi:hypothetical protein
MNDISQMMLQILNGRYHRNNMLKRQFRMLKQIWQNGIDAYRNTSNHFQMIIIRGVGCFSLVR